MNFTSATTLICSGGIARKMPQLPVDQNWNLQVDARIQAYKFTRAEQYSAVFLGVGKTGNYLDNLFLLGFQRRRWDGTEGYYLGDVEFVKGNTVNDVWDDTVNSPAMSFRMNYDAAKHSITYYYDSDGPTGGYQWQRRRVVNIAQGRFNLNMKPTDSFTVFLAGSAKGQKVNNGQAQLDNLRITVGKVTTSALAIQQPAGSDLTAGICRKSFGTQPLGGKGLARVFTIRNCSDETVTGLSVAADGNHAKDFDIATPATVTLAPGEATTFKVTFKPTAAGTRSAAIHIKSNDANENPFDIQISGLGVVP